MRGDEACAPAAQCHAYPCWCKYIVYAAACAKLWLGRGWGALVGSAMPAACGRNEAWTPRAHLTDQGMHAASIPAAVDGRMLLHTRHSDATLTDYDYDHHHQAAVQ